MKHLSMDEIAKAIGGRWLGCRQAGSIAGVTTDTRKAKAGQLFIALRGQRYDGHDYLQQAAHAGCCAAIVDHAAAIDPQILAGFPLGVLAVADTTEGLGALASFYRNQIAATVIAVTGSNGKTTVKRMIHHILSRRLKGSCSPKSFNNNIGLPLTLLEVGGQDDYVVCEAGTNAPNEIAALGKICRPELAVITTIGPSHLEKLIDLQGVAAEKASLLDYLQDGGAAVVPSGCVELEKVLRCRSCNIIRFGLNADSNLRLGNYQPDGVGCRFVVNGKVNVTLPLPGKHNATNALAAMAAAMRLGMQMEEAGAALADFTGAEMRLALTPIGSITVIDDTYNANPASMAAAAAVLAEKDAARRVMIIGDMLELGPQKELLHRQTAHRIVEAGIDLLLGVGAMSRLAVEEAKQLGADAHAFESVEKAGEAITDLLRDGDLVLIKGSRSMGMERLIEAIRRKFEPCGGPRK